MKVWIVEAGEQGEGISVVVGDDGRPLVFADDSYTEAFDAFKAQVKARIGARALFSYPGEIGHVARVHVVARGGGYDEDYAVDIVELHPYDVIGA